jgi:hypothetical protein
LAPNAVVHDPVSTDLPVALSIETTPAVAGAKLADRRLVAPVRHNPAVVGPKVAVANGFGVCRREIGSLGTELAGASASIAWAIEARMQSNGRSSRTVARNRGDGGAAVN